MNPKRAWSGKALPNLRTSWLLRNLACQCNLPWTLIRRMLGLGRAASRLVSSNQAMDMNIDVVTTDLFRPPIHRAMRRLDRSLFRKKVPLAAAKVLEINQISSCRRALRQDLLTIKFINPVRLDPDDPSGKGPKSILLKPAIKPHGGRTFWPFLLRQMKLMIRQIPQHGLGTFKSLSMLRESLLRPTT